MLKPPPSDPGLVTISVLTYRLLLAFYPTRFRREYGLHMVQVFRDCCLMTYRQSGPPGMFSLWVLTLFDWFKTVIEEQVNRETEMTRAKFIRLSGWGMILASVSLLLTFLPEANKILDSLYQTFGVPATSTQHELYQSLSEGVRSLAFPAAILLIILGLVGLRARYGELAGNSAKLALGIGVLGGTVSLVMNVWMVMGHENGRPLMNISMAFMFAGMFVFGLVALRKKTMPRGNGLPALAGFWWPSIVIQAYVFPQVTRQLGPEFPGWLSFTIFSIMCFFLALLGYMLQADVPLVEETDPQA
jgi:hypothetical protein